MRLEPLSGRQVAEAPQPQDALQRERKAGLVVVVVMERAIAGLSLHNQQQGEWVAASFLLMAQTKQVCVTRKTRSVGKEETVSSGCCQHDSIP